MEDNYEFEARLGNTVRASSLEEKKAKQTNKRHSESIKTGRHRLL